MEILRFITLIYLSIGLVFTILNWLAFRKKVEYNSYSQLVKMVGWSMMVLIWPYYFIVGIKSFIKLLKDADDKGDTDVN